MLYDGAIRFVRQARAAIAAGDRKAKATAVGKAVAIITEFSNTLDREIGGEIAADLSRLYDFMIVELARVNARDDASKLDPVEKILLDLREAFAEAAVINHRNSVQATSAESSPSQVAASF